MQKLNELAAREAARRLAAREITAEDLARACLARIEERESTVGAWIHVDPDAVLAQARQLDAGPARGPLHGLPIGVKDIIDTIDMPTCYGSAVYPGHRPAADAAAVALARAHQQRHLGVLERDHRIRGWDHAVQQRKRAVVELHHHAPERFLRLLVRNLEQLQDHRLILAEHLAAGNAKQQAVADLAGSASDGDANGGFRHHENSGFRETTNSTAVQRRYNCPCQPVASSNPWRT